MPSATNLTVKNAAGVDKTFTLLTPAPGYGSPAEWALREGATAVVYPLFSLSAQTNPGRRSRKVRTKMRIPAVYNSVETGLPVVSSYFEVNATIDVPDNFPDSQKDDAVAYATNVMGAALVKACFRDGLPAT